MRIEIYRHPGTPEGVATFYTAVESALEARIEPEAAANVVVRDVFSGLTAITADGEVLVFNMRDSGFECVYECGDIIQSFSLQRGEIEFTHAVLKPSVTDEPRGEVCSTPGCIRGSFHKVPEECSPSVIKEEDR